MDRLPIWDMKAKVRHNKVLGAAIEEAQAVGYANITRRSVATRAGVAVGSVNFAFGDMERLKAAVLAHAVQYGLLDIVAQGLAARNETALNADPELRKRALATLT